MYILYADESGTDAASRYFVLAGLAVFERDTYFLTQELDEVARSNFGSGYESVEFHASSLTAKESRLTPPFDTLDFGQRLAIRHTVYQIIADSKAHAFAIAIEKRALSEPPYEYAMEQLLSRFDRMLGRFYRAGNQQRGIIVVAESSYRENINILGKRVWAGGHRWGDTRNLADVPFFTHARSSRLLQLADFTAHAVYRRYEEGDARHFDPIAQRFDHDSGQLHGLVHHARERWACSCPACVLRRLSQSSDEEQPAELVGGAESEWADNPPGSADDLLP